MTGFCPVFVERFCAVYYENLLEKWKENGGNEIQKSLLPRVSLKLGIALPRILGALL